MAVLERVQGKSVRDAGFGPVRESIPNLDREHVSV